MILSIFVTFENWYYRPEPLNKHENNDINKATPYAISLDNTNYIHCLYNLQFLTQS